MNRIEYIAGIVVVTGLVACLFGLLSYVVWDIFRQAKGLSLSITASSWIARFAVRHPFAVFMAGYAVGALAAHYFWGQSVTVEGKL